MKSLRFFDFFPPPKFLVMPAVGISVESTALRVVSFEKKHNALTLKSIDEIKLEPGVIVAGDIAKPDKLVSVLKDIRSTYGAHFARLALPEEKAYVYETVIPLPEEGDLQDAVEFSLDQNIPLKATDVVFDFEIIEGPFAVNNVQSVRVVVSAYSKGVAETWVELLKQARITPLSFATESQAVARAVVPHGDTEASLLVHFLKDKTIIAISSGGLVRFTTTVSSSLENSDKILKSHEGEKIAESVELLSVSDEVKKVYSYWISRSGVKSKNDSGKIKALVVSGHVGDMTDVADYLGKNIGIPARRGNVWVNAFSLDAVVPSIPFEESLLFSAAIGAALS